MEEYIKHIEYILDLYKNDETQKYELVAYLFPKSLKAIENILQAYKQDEKVINEMASYLVKDCEQIEKLECEEIAKRLEKTPYNCIDCIISCFRKKCE